MTRYGQFTIGIGSITLNSNVHAGQSFYMLTNVPDIMTVLSVRNEDIEKQGDHGAEDGPAYYGPRTLPISGEIHALTAEARYEMEEDLKEELALPIAPDTFGDDGYKLILIRDQDGTLKQAYAKIISPPKFEMMSDVMERRSRFSFVLYAKDPKFYAQALQEETGGESSRSTTFTTKDGALPTFKDVLINFMTVTNAGRFGTPPLIVINGPTSSPVVKNETTGKSMTLYGLTLVSGESVEIDVGGTPVSITKIDSIGTETDVSGYLSDDSEWIFLNPGINVLSLFDSTPDELQASLEVRWRNSWI